jgi:Ca2+-binding RTX toxin-like protein
VHIDPLEPRQLFAATAYLDGNVLRVIGTEGNDTIELKSVPTESTGNTLLYAIEVDVNGAMVGGQIFGNVDQISRIAIEAGAGNDRVTLPDRFALEDPTPIHIQPVPGPADTRVLRKIRAHVTGGAGNDTIAGGAGNDLLEGNGGNDNLAGRDGNDNLFGGSGQDKLNGDNGDDRLDGGKGNDGLAGGLGGDVFIGGAGSDTVDYGDHTQAVFAELLDNGQHTQNVIPLDGLEDFYGMGKFEHDNIPTDVENIKGGSGDDRLIGNNSSNVIVGGEGNDTIQGGGLPDTLYGNAGDDHFESSGDPIADRVVGGPGRDDGLVDSSDVLVSIERPTIGPIIPS